MSAPQAPPTAPVLLPPALAAELGDLHDDQRRAATHHGNLTVVAGPGAGKTRTLVARIGYLLAATSSRRGVAALTYTEAAAGETTRRLHRLGLHPGRRLTSSTVHAFCLHHILRPYGRIAGDPLHPDIAIAENATCSSLWNTAAQHTGLTTPVRSYDRTTLERLRRLLSAGENTDDYNDSYRDTVAAYERLLRERHLLDFEAMTGRALRVLRDSRTARQQAVARYPHLVVDEYQDLGPVLHALVEVLHEAGAEITAVGDPDQVMYAYQGASARYLRRLQSRPDFETIKLTVNYRSGSTLIAAGGAILRADRGYLPAPDRDDVGTVTVRDVVGDLDQHARQTVEEIRTRLTAGTPAEEIAVLYRAQGPLLSELVQALDAAGIPVDTERQRLRPDGPLADFVAACTARRLTGPLPGPPVGGTGPGRRQRRSAGVAPPRTLRELAAIWRRLSQLAGLSLAEESLRALARRLVTVLDAPERPAPTDDASGFMATLSVALDLATLAQHSPDPRDHSTAQTLDVRVGELTMAELAGGQVPGRVALTTYHSAKGREFSIVVLPGLIEGLMPSYYPNKPLTTRDEAEARRSFYVALTRARDEVILIAGTGYTMPGNDWREPQWRRSRRSRFVDEVVAHLR